MQVSKVEFFDSENDNIPYYWPSVYFKLFGGELIFHLSGRHLDLVEERNILKRFTFNIGKILTVIALITPAFGILHSYPNKSKWEAKSDSRYNY